jgi:phage shock protein A
MGIFDRIGRVIRANVNDLIDKAEDPEKVLEQTIQDMQDDLVKMRQAVAQGIATQKRTEQQYQKNMNEANRWQQRAQLALEKGEEGLAREALVRKKTFADTAVTLQTQLGQQSSQVEILRRNLVTLEGKLTEAKTKKNMLKARLSAAKAHEQLQNTIANLNTNSSMAAFERMEEKVLQAEAISQTAGELGGTGIEEEFLKLESTEDVDDELAMMKAKLSGNSSTPEALPPTSGTDTTSPSSPTPDLDNELEELRRQLNQN